MGSIRTHVCIGSCHSERVDADPLIFASRPWLSLGRNAKFCFLPRNFYILSAVILRGRQTLAVDSGRTLLLGLGFSIYILGGMTLCSRARTPLMILVRPAAPSECPTFGLTYCSRPCQSANSEQVPITSHRKSLTAPILTPPWSFQILATAATSRGSPVGVPVP